MIFSLGTAMLLLRNLSKEDFAAWGLFLFFTYLLEMGRSGLIQNGLVRHLALYRAAAAESAAIRRASLWLNLAFSLGSNLVLWLGMNWIIRNWQAPQLAAVLPVYFVSNFAMAWFYHFNFVQQANHEFRGIFWATFCFRGMLFVWTAWCKIAGIPIELQSLAIAMLAGALLGMLVSRLYFLRLPGLARLAPAPARVWHWVRELAAYGKWVMGTNLSTMLYKNMDRLVLGKLLGPPAYAVYDAAGKVTQMVEAPSFSIAAVAFPLGAERMAAHGKDGIRRLYERSVGAILAIILPFLIGVLLFARPVMLAFAGPQYLESVGVLRLTAFFGLFLPFAVQFGTVLDSTGKPAVNFAYTLFTVVLNLGLSLWFVHWYGLPGAALATLAGYAISFVFMQRYLYRNFGIRAWRAFAEVPGFYRLGWGMVMARVMKHTF